MTGRVQLPVSASPRLGLSEREYFRLRMNGLYELENIQKKGEWVDRILNDAPSWLYD